MNTTEERDRIPNLVYGSKRDDKFIEVVNTKTSSQKILCRFIPESIERYLQIQAEMAKNEFVHQINLVSVFEEPSMQFVHYLQLNYQGNLSACSDCTNPLCVNCAAAYTTCSACAVGFVMTTG